MPCASGWVFPKVFVLLAVCGLTAPAVAQDRDHHSGKKKHAVVKKKASEAVEAVPAPLEVSHAAPAPEPAQKEEMQTRGPTRLDFDDRVVQGQGSKIGAVYLYDRKNLPLRSMVKKRESFRDQIDTDAVTGAVVE